MPVKEKFKMYQRLYSDPEVQPDEPEEVRKDYSQQVVNLITIALSNYPSVDALTQYRDLINGTIEIRLRLSK